MKKLLLGVMIVAGLGLAASPIFSQQKESAPAHQGHGMGDGMHQGSMMCPMMGGAGKMGMGGMAMMGGMMGGAGMGRAGMGQPMGRPDMSGAPPRNTRQPGTSPEVMTPPEPPVSEPEAPAESDMEKAGKFMKGLFGQ